MQLQITIEVWDKGKWFVATCPELDFMAQGPTREQARLNLLEVINIQCQEMTAMHTLNDYLSECGYVRQNGSFIAQSQMVALERQAVQVACCLESHLLTGRRL